ncbi:Hypothetical_protein [Hexamita inflata]|uniref:Hypothetical_protein n=1 Tax=Hexamita inflata TaxID=28002 RepID=A0AA86N4Y4_9EUKA|nr:Hypothetical protein HINF_LOCUS471 [Hexamita inflata]
MQSDCLNACSNGYCNNTYSYSYGRNMYNCVQNPSGIFNTLEKCNNNCTSGYCNQTYNNNHSRYEYNCTNNDASIYNSYNSCSDNCYDGYCDSSYSYSHSRYEYSCVKYTTDNNACYLMLLLIPAFFSFIITIVCCCYKQNKVGRTTKTIQKQALKQQRDELIIQTVTEVTLPNGQTGLFVPHSNSTRQITKNEPSSDLLSATYLLTTASLNGGSKFSTVPNCSKSTGLDNQNADYHNRRLCHQYHSE